MSMLEAALDYAAKGWPVFPCSPVNKKPLTRHGFKDATTDPLTIRGWWPFDTEWSMIGVPTGEPIGAFVLDINPPEGMSMAEALGHITAAIGLIPATWETQTPNGAHIWFKLPEGAKVSNRGPLLGGAIDCVRGTGGYVIVPPSINLTKGQYRWVTSEGVPIALAPEALLKLVVK